MPNINKKEFKFMFHYKLRHAALRSGDNHSITNIPYLSVMAELATGARKARNGGLLQGKVSGEAQFFIN